MTVYITTRDLSIDECPWLPRDIDAGTMLTKFTKPTYGCVKELAVTLNENGDYPFFEVPWNSVEKVAV